MILEKGITGFFDTEESPSGENSYRVFKKACYSICMNFWHLKNVCSPEHTNYFYAHFIISGQNLYILLNRYYPIIGFTKELTMNNKTFIDISESINMFTNYNMIKADILNAPFKESGHNLCKAELKQISYWNPATIGNIIFNEWD